MAINVTQSSMPDFEEYIDEIRDLWDSHWLTNMGIKHKELEIKLQEYLKVDNITLYTNGHLALEAIIEAFELNGEVITTPFTFASTTHAIVRKGLTPVFCDIDPNDYTIDASKIEALITDKTVAILPVHVYGNTCNVQEIQRIAEKHNLKVIYDAAHSFGVSVNGIGVGMFGDASMFSFHATKVFNTIEGGGVCCRDPLIKHRLDNIKNYGINGPEVIEQVGGNAKMNEFQAAMGLCNLRHIDDEILKREKVFNRYLENLKNIKGIKLPVIKVGVKHNYAYFPIVFDEYKVSRNDVHHHLRENDINTRKYFYPLTSNFECYKEHYNDSDTPVAKYISDRILTLPIYADLSLDDVDRICQIIYKL